MDHADQGGADPPLFRYEQYGLLFDATFVLTIGAAAAALLWRRRQSFRLVETLRDHYRDGSPPQWTPSHPPGSRDAEANSKKSTLPACKDHKER